MDHTIAFNLDIDSEALHEKLLMLIISAERPELIVNYEREKADLLFLEQEDKEVHVSMSILSVKKFVDRKKFVSKKVRCCATRNDRFSSDRETAHVQNFNFLDHVLGIIMFRR